MTIEYEYDMPGINRRLSDLIKSRRSELGITQKRLAEGTGIDLKYIQRIESPKVMIEPRLSTLGRICSKLDISLKEMMNVILE